ncbi:dTDP-4-dehydrorhamnose 3,5-epimerase family protein [Nocardiopsis sp. ATB16-24]|uniref:dTDP-4-dehydrorhamnose 3,5-epimerase family protein n=1 Tax=Nocardiopsis sp. ATB16-24 TaxID=3019555 RepID=UPI002554C3B7|nr:dTDP-4-dehydrorhamnose 3,5-epimerase family protein [Nocardiopsis sp. ATB16-24]
MTAKISRTAVPGVLVFDPVRILDERGSFHEGMRVDSVESASGVPFHPRQINFSVSRNNTLRGIHSVTVPPGQAKYVTCVRGAIRDIVVDLRIGSPTFGAYHVTSLDAESGRSVYVPPGVGHGFLSLADDSCVCYVLSTAHVQGTQVDIDPLDPELDLPWGFTEPPLMSEKDAQAGGVAEAAAAGLLARWEDTR